MRIFRLISLCVAIYCRKGLKACSLLAFIPLLVIVNLTELIGIELPSVLGGLRIILSITSISSVSTPFFFYLAGKMLFLTKKETIVFTIVCSLCLLLILVNYGFIQGQVQFNTFSLGLEEIMLIIFSGLCLLRLTVLDREEINFMKEPYFWINSLNLLGGLITVVVLGLQSYILLNKIEIANRSLYAAILPVVNAIVYSGYSYAFMLCKMQKTR